jgi:monoamine oxidase
MDTIVIGAGLAGLAASQRLVQAGHSVTIIEARDRIGGRVFTARDSDSAPPIDYGAEWFASTGGVRNLLAAAGATMHRGSGAFLRRTSEGWSNAFEDHPATSDLLGRMGKHTGDDRSLRDALVECGSAHQVDEAQAFVRFVESFHAADPGDVSARWLTWMEEAHAPGEAEYRSLSGAGAVVEALAASLTAHCEIRLRTVAREIRWRAGAVEVVVGDGADDVLSARSAVVTVPLPMLAGSSRTPGAIRFSPDIAEKREAASRLRMGHAAKVVFRFKTPFWRAVKPLANMVFVFADGEPFPVWWSGVGRTPTITGWAGGPKALRLAIEEEEAVIDRAIDSLTVALALPRGRIEEQLVSHHYHNWSADPNSQGAYSYVAAGGIDAHLTLARPVGDTLFFAGEATCGGGYNATMEGAAQSGWRAAAEVIDAAARAPRG